jgi:hypothetical protein
MEDDMSLHEEARADCVQALKDLSLLPTAPAGARSDPESTLSVNEMLAELSQSRAGDLSAPQLEMMLSKQQDGDLMKAFMCSLGDLGRKDIRHEPGDAGTTKSFQDAKAFLDEFGLPYELVSGNHDLGKSKW